MPLLSFSKVAGTTETVRAALSPFVGSTVVPITTTLVNFLRIDVSSVRNIHESPRSAVVGIARLCGIAAGAPTNGTSS